MVGEKVRLAVGDWGHPAVAERPCADYARKAEEVTLGTNHARAKTLALFVSCGGKHAGFQANIKRRYFRMVRVRDGWEHRETRDRKMSSEALVYHGSVSEAVERMSGSVLLRGAV